MLGVLAAVLLAVVVGCDAPGAATPTLLDSGIRGRVLLGPTCPAASAGDTPCLTPYEATLVVLGDDNQEVATIDSSADGRFELSLPPGEYVVSPEQGDPYPIAVPVPVIVVAGQFAEVEINYDTGVR